ncbi:hypothetical protein NCR96_02170 [Helicobacter sp. 14348-15]|uniref:hypothetical protein n=1 Tax=Helicobacter colisuis TaxID=2949739 RepID=UPI00202B5439|nr:hypothetical protein [Helicobacter colisuis]MCL9820556.1 hypothetical protein [Helicobacter colisuis]
MRIKTAIFVLVGILIVSGSLATIFWGRLFAFSFVFAFLSFLMIVGFTCLAQKNKISRLILRSSKEELEVLANLYQSKEDKEEEFWDENAPQISEEEFVKEYKQRGRKFWRGFSKDTSKFGFKMFFMPLRLLAYALFAILFLIFLKKGWLDFVGFFSGLILANIAVVLVLLFEFLRTK